MVSSQLKPAMKQGTNPGRRDGSDHSCCCWGNADLHHLAGPFDGTRLTHTRCRASGCWKTRNPPEPRPGSWASTSPTPARLAAGAATSGPSYFLSIFLQKNPFRSLLELLELCKGKGGKTIYVNFLFPCVSLKPARQSWVPDPPVTVTSLSPPWCVCPLGHLCTFRSPPHR